jgi:hypothetical protein
MDRIRRDFPTTTGTFKQSQFINLQAYKTDHTYCLGIDWFWIGSDSAEWTLDDANNKHL